MGDKTSNFAKVRLKLCMKPVAGQTLPQSPRAPVGHQPLEIMHNGDQIDFNFFVHQMKLNIFLSFSAKKKQHPHNF